MRFLRVIEGLLPPVPVAVPRPNIGRAPAILFPVSIRIPDCFAGEPLDISKGPEFELCCLAGGGHISSLGPGVSGVATDQSARDKSTSISWGVYETDNFCLAN